MDGRRVVLTVGALQKRKGQDMMIRALPEIRARCPDVSTRSSARAGSAPTCRISSRSSDVTGPFSFAVVPADDELVECYQQCDLFALPNRQVGWDFEGFGIVLLEAQACAKPVIAGQSGGTSETIQAGRTGEVVPCESPGALAQATVAMLEQPQQRAAMGRCGRQWVVERFDWAILAGQAHALFTAA